METHFLQNQAIVWIYLPTEEREKSNSQNNSYFIVHLYTTHWVLSCLLGFQTIFI